MTFKITLLILKLIGTAKATNTHVSGHIVGGENSKIENFPYSVFLIINCNGITSYCGASILNQVLLLTAAHCVNKCKNEFTIEALTASAHRGKGFVNIVVHFIVHEKYDTKSMANDIALLKLEEHLIFGPKVKRIAVLKVPPDYKTAVVAGWGWIDSVGTKGTVLKHASQQVYNRSTCIKILNRIPVGSICGREQEGVSYPERGDSGSALVVHDFIQIGLVSFKKRAYSNVTNVYTDVAYHYDWIKKKAEELYCGTEDWVKKKNGNETGKIQIMTKRTVVKCKLLMKIYRTEPFIAN